MQTSEQINELATALALAQGEMSNAKKNSANPHFRSSYADLASVREACLAALTAHGIAVVQSPRFHLLDGQAIVEVETRFLHKSGQWMADCLAVPVTKVDAQGVASAITYGRRYALAAWAGVAPADDDGEAAVGRRDAAPRVRVKPEGFDDWLSDLTATADTGFPALEKAWKASSNDYRDYLRATSPQVLDALKATAKAVAA